MAGIPEEDRIEVELIGQDGNVFNLMGITSKAMKRAGQAEAANEMCDRIVHSSSYDEALRIIMEYVEVT